MSAGIYRCVVIVGSTTCQQSNALMESFPQRDGKAQITPDLPLCPEVRSAMEDFGTFRRPLPTCVLK